MTIESWDYIDFLSDDAIDYIVREELKKIVEYATEEDDNLSMLAAKHILTDWYYIPAEEL